MSTKFQELLCAAIGEASMCYSEAPTGVFDSTRALNIVKDIYSEHVAEVEQLKAKCEKYEKALLEISKVYFIQGSSVKLMCSEALEQYDMSENIRTPAEVYADKRQKELEESHDGATTVSIRKERILAYNQALADHESQSAVGWPIEKMGGLICPNCRTLLSYHKSQSVIGVDVRQPTGEEHGDD
jgi:hypothetical protein